MSVRDEEVIVRSDGCGVSVRGIGVNGVSVRLWVCEG